jgi:hypothetical protein
VTVSAGDVAPEQAEESLPSFAHRPTARPDPSVRNAPADPDFVVITRPEPAGTAAGLGVPPADEAAADELLLPELLQAAVGRVPPGAAASPAPSQTAPGIRIPTDALIATVSRLLACATICRHSPYGRSGAAA